MEKGYNGIYNRYIKRFFDFVISLFGIIILSPLLLVLIVVGAIAMRGNPFFFQERPGHISRKTGRERVFRLVKFRTMSDKKDSEGNLLPDGERLNGYGTFLRKTSLDELPELFNIFVGDMALIGPRPLLVEYLDLYTDEQRRRHTVRQGMTGWAQVNGRNAITWERKFEYDVWYVDNVSFSLDFKIVFMTVKSVLGQSGINASENDTMPKFEGKRAEKVYK